MIMKVLISWYLAFSSESVSESDQMRHCNVLSTIRITKCKWKKLHSICLTFIKGFLFVKMDHWSVNSSNETNWYTNKWTLVMQLIKPLSNRLGKPFRQAACTFDYVHMFWIFVTCICAESHWYWILGSIGKIDREKE